MDRKMLRPVRAWVARRTTDRILGAFTFSEAVSMEVSTFYAFGSPDSMMRFMYRSMMEKRVTAQLRLEGIESKIVIEDADSPRKLRVTARLL